MGGAGTRSQHLSKHMAYARACTMPSVRCVPHSVGCLSPGARKVALAPQPSAPQMRCRLFTMPAALCLTHQAGVQPARRMQQLHPHLGTPSALLDAPGGRAACAPYKTVTSLSILHLWKMMLQLQVNAQCLDAVHAVHYALRLVVYADGGSAVCAPCAHSYNFVFVAPSDPS